jgi:hypothetical protein
MAGMSGIGGILESPRRQRQLFIGSGAVLLIGIVAFVATVLLKNNGNKFTDTFSNQPAKLAEKDPATRITKDELTLARTFIKTAVMRKQLDKAYDLVDVDLRGRMTRKQWDTGNIPVISYEAQNADTAALTVDYSHQRSALLEVDLVAKPNTETRPHLLFFLGLKRKGDSKTGQWLVNYWEPHWRPPIPMAPN